MIHNTYTDSDVPHSPLMFYYETTTACDLVCKHCRASAQENTAADELSTQQSIALIEQAAMFPRKPNFCFTGGDPLKRKDIFQLIRHAVSLGLQVALTPSATPLANYEAFLEAKESGVQALGISLDGPNAEIHDAFRGFSGSFVKTLEMLSFARKLQIPVQINTSITKRNVDYIDEMAELLANQGIRMWAVFFLVPVGRGMSEERIRPDEYEKVFEKLWKHSKTKPFSIKTTEAPHYRRFLAERGEKTPSFGITDGRGIMFVSQNGTIYPAGFLPISCGQFPTDSVVETYQKHPLFKSLQNPNEFKGICGACEYRFLCGGSRARAYGVYGDALAAEPDCFFERNR